MILRFMYIINKLLAIQIKIVAVLFKLNEYMHIYYALLQSISTYKFIF